MGSQRVTDVQAEVEYRLRLTFDDGVEGIIDVEPRLWGPMFASLRDPDAFARVRVDADAGTVVWPNGADLSPEMLYREVKRSTSSH